MKNHILKATAVLAFFFSMPALRAQVVLQPLFSDNMVLQQKSQAPLWGMSKPSSTVRVVTSWNKQTVSTTADASGHWKVTVATPKAGGPYTITIDDGTPLTLHNVMIGEVWLCTGQSNMEMPLAGWGKIDNYEAEIADASRYPDIRIMNVKNAISPTPLDTFLAEDGGWQVCSSSTIGEFSAAGYFFGRRLWQELKVPIGLIGCNWGGTLAEAWTSEQSIMQMPYFRELTQKVKQMPPTREALQRLYEQEERDYWQAIYDAEQGRTAEGYLWANADYDDSSWPEMRQPGKIEENGLSGFDGVVWIRKTFELPAGWEQHDLTLSLGAIDDEDNTFFNGTEVGHTDSWFAPRTYTIPARLVKAGTNTIAIRITDTGVDGGLTSEADQLRLSSAAGTLSLAGPWRYHTAVNLHDFPPRPVNMAGNPNLPTVLYNAMLHPLIPYTLRGAIWYQGESNADRANQYRELLPLMINDWRTQWGADLDFYIVQLANFMRQQIEPEESAWAELREAQQHTADHLQHCGIATAIDIGMADDIHPKNKQEVGRRLALAALAQTYGKKLEYSGPVYKSYRIEGNKIRLYFDHVGKGFVTDQVPAPKTFTIAGPDKKFHWAEARIEGETIVVWSPEVSFPVSVRYGWANNPDTKTVIRNTAGLPMLPFRTDQWQGVTR